VTQSCQLARNQERLPLTAAPAMLRVDLQNPKRRTGTRCEAVGLSFVKG
jgi:hypothetical protein